MHAVHSPAHRAAVAKLRAARKRAKLTQEQVAAALGIPQERIAKIETGQRRMDVGELWAFAKLYKLSMKSLRYWVED